MVNQFTSFPSRSSRSARTTRFSSPKTSSICSSGTPLVSGSSVEDSKADDIEAGNDLVRVMRETVKHNRPHLIKPQLGEALAQPLADVDALLTVVHGEDLPNIHPFAERPTRQRTSTV